MEKSSGLHILYKKLGETPLQSIQRFKGENPEYEGVPMTYAGRLDPMAEGLLPVLSGERVGEKEKFLDLPKTYVFEVLWGFDTDTLDILGKVSQCESTQYLVPSKEEIEEVLRNSIGKIEQKYPNYSSKPVLGVPLFDLSRQELLHTVEIPTHEVEIHDAKYISRRTVAGGELLSEIERRIALVTGDFRQEEIMHRWSEMLSKMPSYTRYIIDTAEITVSRGFYVRQFVADFSRNFGTFAIAFHIFRSKIGDFDLKAVEN